MAMARKYVRKIPIERGNRRSVDQQVERTFEILRGCAVLGLPCPTNRQLAAMNPGVEQSALAWHLTRLEAHGRIKRERRANSRKRRVVILGEPGSYATDWSVTPGHGAETGLAATVTMEFDAVAARMAEEEARLAERRDAVAAERDARVPPPRARYQAA